MVEKSIIRLMAYLFFIHSTMTIIIGYIPVFYQGQGLTGSQVGLLMAIGPIATIVAQPFWGYMSDKYKSIKRMIILALFGLFLSTAAFLIVDSFYGYMILMFVLYVFVSPTTALGDSLAQQTAIEKKVTFGSIRMWGSLGFAITSLLTGYLLTWIGVNYIMYPMMFMAIIALIIAFGVKDVPQTNKPVTIVDALRLSTNRTLMLFLLFVVFISSTHRANDTYLGLYIVELGGPEAMIGWAWFIGVVAEAAIFATSAYWFKRWSPLTFIILAGGLYTIRWALMGLITNPWFILPLQVTHGLTFGVLYLAAFQFVNHLIPKHLQATGHVLFITIVFGVSGIIGSLVGGYIIELTSMNTLYSLLAISAFVGVICLALFQKLMAGTKNRLGVREIE